MSVCVCITWFKLSFFATSFGLRKNQSVFLDNVLVLRISSYASMSVCVQHGLKVSLIPSLVWRKSQSVFLDNVLGLRIRSYASMSVSLITRFTSFADTMAMVRRKCQFVFLDRVLGQ